ncbi:hypothetical protein BH23BAC3_BH23BAC3_23560 [soil metagenome]
MHVLSKTNDTIIIQKSPKAFPETDYKNIRRAIIVPQIALFYRLNSKDDSIDLLRFGATFRIRTLFHFNSTPCVSLHQNHLSRLHKFPGVRAIEIDTTG